MAVKVPAVRAKAPFTSFGYLMNQALPQSMPKLRSQPSETSCSSWIRMSTLRPMSFVPSPNASKSYFQEVEAESSKRTPVPLKCCRPMLTVNLQWRSA